MPSPPEERVHRILDASANRAAEGLRTIEEFARFIEDDPELSTRLKSLRHDLAAAMGRIPRRDLLTARDTAGDVGTTISNVAETRRTGLSEVVAAAASRTQQSLRCLEEYGKTIDPHFAASVESVRYRCYDIAAAVELRVTPDRRRRRLDASLLYLLVDADASADAFAVKIRTLSAAGADVFQLRDRGHDDRTLYERAVLGARVAREADVLFLVNDRADLAAAADADGVHVGQEELPAAAARRVVGPQRLVGVSTHSREQAEAAVVDGADYIGFGPMFPGATKSFDAFVGTDALAEVASGTPLPTFAIGGINGNNLDRVLAAGARRIAVTSAISAANDPIVATRELKRRLTLSSPHS